MTITASTRCWVNAGNYTMVNMPSSSEDIGKVWGKFGLPWLWWRKRGRSVVFLNTPGCLWPRPCCQGWDTWLCVYLVLSVSIILPILTMSWETVAVSLYLQQGEGGSVNVRYLPHVTEKQERDCGLELRQLASHAMVTVKMAQKPISLLLWLHGKSMWMSTSGGLCLSLLFCACGSFFCVPFP